MGTGEAGGAAGGGGVGRGWSEERLGGRVASRVCAPSNRGDAAGWTAGPGVQKDLCRARWTRGSGWTSGGLSGVWTGFLEDRVRWGISVDLPCVVDCGWRCMFELVGQPVTAGVRGA